jgi:hypothetical protein
LPEDYFKDCSVPITPAEILAKEMESEVSRLAPQAVIRNDFANYKDDGVDIYIYAPRKVSDILRSRLKPIFATEMTKSKGGLKAKLLVEDIENMSPEAKKKYGIPA